ncbi:MAG: hypothetical protein GF418_05355 [Chitinivibrionales bacterium]|nr:hypothetical protein [Chitinivibrionales bacterium]MBD3395038.1 hypothetical protein [Chitinivibrionales bacterium]
MMNNLRARFPRAVPSCLTAVLFLAGLAGADTVTVAVGDNIQSAVNANPGTTVFVLEQGTHRLQSVEPKSGNTFIGEYGAIMSGARVLEDWQQDGGRWYHDGQTQENPEGSGCTDDYPACIYPEDLFMDNEFLKQVLSLGAVGPGTWYFDYANDRVYMGDDPGEHTMEIGVTMHAFHSESAENVTIRNLVVEKYAVRSQFGAIQYDPGSGSGWQDKPGGWIVEDCELRYNHGAAVYLTGICKIAGCYVHHNGQIGIKVRGGLTVNLATQDAHPEYFSPHSLLGSGSLVHGNEICYNGYQGYSGGWEAGGTKFMWTDSLVIRSNYAHHNHGSGLWCDLSNVHVLYEGNLAEHNTHQGIFHEVSDTAVIRCNVCRDGGTYEWPRWLYNGQLSVSASRNVEVYNNVVEVHESYGNGIAIINQPFRYDPDQDGFHSEWTDRGIYAMAYNIYVHDNHITHDGNSGANGVVCDGGEAQRNHFWANNEILFDRNAYHVPSDAGVFWQWNGG